MSVHAWVNVVPISINFPSSCTCSRFTAELAARAEHVHSTDFMQKFVDENMATNGPRHPNLTFAQLDASNLPYGPETFHFIFTNWLLMYLDNTEVDRFAAQALKYACNSMCKCTA